MLSFWLRSLVDSSLILGWSSDLIGFSYDFFNIPWRIKKGEVQFLTDKEMFCLCHYVIEAHSISLLHNIPSLCKVPSRSVICWSFILRLTLILSLLFPYSLCCLLLLLWSLGTHHWSGPWSLYQSLKFSTNRETKTRGCISNHRKCL